MNRLTEEEHRRFAYYVRKKRLNFIQKRRFRKLVKKATSIPISKDYNSIQLEQSISYIKPKTLLQKIFR